MVTKLSKTAGMRITLLAIGWFVLGAPFLAQEATVPSEPLAEEEPTLAPTDWAPELLYEILSSPNSEASDALYRAAFAAGPDIVPQLEKALPDDRTAEFAAQSLAFIGGEKAIRILWGLIRDPRDLNLRRFYYSALAEFDAPEALQTLLGVINRADDEPDRTVTEAAILALTVQSNMDLIPELGAAKAKIEDVVIQLDLENAMEVIEGRARYLETPAGKEMGGSVDDAVRKYFIPALQPLGTPGEAPPQTSPPLVTVTVRHLTLSPDKTRALARVVFEDPSAAANYDMVLQKRYGNWQLASVWLGEEIEKPPPLPPPAVSPP